MLTKAPPARVRVTSHAVARRATTASRTRSILGVLHRALVLVAAFVYITRSIQATIAALRVLRGTRNPAMNFEAYESYLITNYTGTGLIRDSPVVTELLANDTSPRSYSIYLEEGGVVSTVGCSAANFSSAMYGSLFPRLGLMSLTRDTTFKYTELQNYELVVPIIDCSFTPIKRGARSLVRLYYVMRNRADPLEVALGSVRFNMQDYRIADRKERGPIGLLTYAFIFDMSVPKVSYRFSGALGYPFDPASFTVYNRAGMATDGWWSFQSVPSMTLLEAPHTMITSSRTGFYVGSDAEQSNIKNRYWETDDDDPFTSLTQWNWKGETVLRDSWAWVHMIHAMFALDGLFHISLLLLLSYRNGEKGKIWMGDAFASISTTLLGRGVLIAASSMLNGFWTLMEFCLHDAHHHAGTEEIFFHPEMIHADLLTIFLAFAALIGHVLGERIDPAFVILLFEVSFEYRLSIAWLYPTTMAYLVNYAVRDQARSLVMVSKTVALSSPLRLWTSRELPPKDVGFILGCLLPMFGMSALVIIYAVLRKLYRRGQTRRDPVYTHNSRVSAQDTSTLLQPKSQLTVFELATGVELQNRFGVVCDFENYRFIKGMKYASADGIYCNGYVIVNDKALVAILDLQALLLIKITRIRVKNIFIYDITGNTVQSTSHLFYPDTLSWRDIFHLNLSVLS